ncbi:MAG: adenylate/guanylate cyclase domain-containing protein, partial [Fimbriimonas sp.]
MDPTLADDSPKEQRLLAAIVFTDVVGFSRLAAKNEARVYVSLQRDMGVMQDLCRAHGGQVLNTMGDGMLLCFPSAVDAMAAAVEMQRTLAAQAQSLPPTDVLHHRIGVHLGDVIVKGDNVFGDGVNTAARLQNDARPDSIWYSQTVNEVIKNKLKIDAKYIGKRQFKNLGEPVSVWEIPPVAESRAQLEADAIGLGAPGMLQEPEGVGGGKAFLVVLASVIMVGSAVFLFTRINTSNIKDKPKVKSNVNKPAPVQPETVSTTGETATSASTGTTTAPTITTSDAQKRIDDLKRSYAFAEIADYLMAEGRVLPDAGAMHDKYWKLAQMRAWMEAAIQASTGSDMIQAQLSIGAADIYSQPPPMIQINKAGFQ